MVLDSLRCTFLVTIVCFLRVDGTGKKYNAKSAFQHAVE